MAWFRRYESESHFQQYPFTYCSSNNLQLNPNFFRHLFLQTSSIVKWGWRSQKSSLFHVSNLFLIMCFLDPIPLDILRIRAKPCLKKRGCQIWTHLRGIGLKSPTKNMGFFKLILKVLLGSPPALKQYLSYSLTIIFTAMVWKLFFGS